MNSEGAGNINIALPPPAKSVIELSQKELELTKSARKAAKTTSAAAGTPSRGAPRTTSPSKAKPFQKSTNNTSGNGISNYNYNGVSNDNNLSRTNPRIAEPIVQPFQQRFQSKVSPPSPSDTDDSSPARFLSKYPSQPPQQVTFRYFNTL